MGKNLSNYAVFLWVIFLVGCDFGLDAPTEDANGIYLELLSSTLVVADILLVKGNKACMIYGHWLHIFDLSDKLNPKHLSQHNVKERVKDAVIRGSYIYSISDYKLIIVNISSPSSPHTISELELEHKAKGIEIDGNYAYVRASDHLLIIDVSSPANPLLANTVHFPDRLVDCVVEDRVGYMVSQNLLFTYDFSNPTNPRELFETGRGLENLKKNSNYLYATSYLRLNVLKIRSPRELQYIRYVEFPVKIIDLDFEKYGVATDNSTLYLLDISNPSFPCVTEKISGGSHSITMEGDYIYYLASLGYHQYFTILKIEHVR